MSIEASKWNFIQEYEKSIGKCAKIRYVYLYMDLRRTLKLFLFLFFSFFSVDLLILLAAGIRTNRNRKIKYEMRGEKKSNIAMDSFWIHLRQGEYGKNRRVAFTIYFLFVMVTCLLRNDGGWITIEKSAVHSSRHVIIILLLLFQHFFSLFFFYCFCFHLLFLISLNVHLSMGFKQIMECKANQRENGK